MNKAKSNKNFEIGVSKNPFEGICDLIIEYVFLEPLK